MMQCKIQDSGEKGKKLELDTKKIALEWENIFFSLVLVYAISTVFKLVMGISPII